jgi:hypothetical protein
MWDMETHPLPYDEARTVAEFIAGNQHVGLFHQGLELSTGLNPLPGYRDVRIEDLALDGRGGGLALYGATGADTTGRIAYPAQLYDRWTIIWQETTDSGATWSGGAIRDDAVGYVDGVADATAGAAGTTLQIEVRDGVAYLDSGGVDVGIHQLVIAPYRIAASWLVTMTAAGFDQQSPSPIHEMRGDALPEGWGDPAEGFRYVMGRRVQFDFVPRPDDVGTWDPAGHSVKFQLVEVDRFGRQSAAILAEPNLVPPPPLPESGNLQLDFDANQPGAGNVPTNIGLNANVGDLTLVGSGYTYSATGGPNGHARHTYAGTGYHRGAADTGQPAISTGDWTMAVLCNPTNNNNAVIFRCAASGNNEPYFVTNQITATTYRYSINNNSQRLPSTAPTEGTQWDVIVCTFTNGTGRVRLYHAKLGDPTITDGGDGDIETEAVGENVNFGGSYAAGDHVGHITRAMVWDKLVGAQSILDYINSEYS